MNLGFLTFLNLNLIHLIDYGFHDGVTMAEVKQHIQTGDLLDWLAERFDGHIDMSMHRALHHSDDASELIERLRDLVGGYSGSERRKWGVQHNGICLLATWTNEIIAQRQWVDDPRVAA